MADRIKKGGKTSPKIKRSGRVSTKQKYLRQFSRTYKNKLRRVRKHNGEVAAQKYIQQHYKI